MTNTQPVAVIIGMGPGLSAALAQRFAAGGYAVAGFARNPDKSADLAARMAAAGRRLEMRHVDAADFGALATAMRAADDTIGPVEVLIYNAYRATFALPSQVNPGDLVADFAVNVGGALAATQAALPTMLSRGRGTILFTGGGLALDPTGWLPAASLAVGKAGIRSLAQTLNKELEGSPVRAATVTVAGQIADGTAFAPDLIAERFWQMHAMPGPVPAETIYAGRAG